MTLTLQYTLFIPIILFSIGFFGIIIHKNLLSIFLGIEIMINASAIIYIIAENYWKNINGQIMYIIMITTVASETSILLILLLKLQKKNSLSITSISKR
ncbi:MAG: NADH:quinone oxidoreductase subunit K [Candidatus Westeberhardia cardiocondylae]|nr:NADH:quinone oxidoreductase subunit K [Candidatus Westeberhardia cardiocondylae]